MSLTRESWAGSIRPGPVLAGLLLWASTALAEHYTLPLFMVPTTDVAATGVVRILNATHRSGTVKIYAVDDAGTRWGPATLTLHASAAAEFTAADLVSGNVMKGLTGGVGYLTGDLRLEIDTDLRIVPAAYVRGADGALSAMHDTVRTRAASGGGYEYLVPIFYPSTEMTRVSRLRLINPGEAVASVMIEGRDDHGTAATGGAVQLRLEAGAATALTAQQLEAGDARIIGLTGRLGAGVGKWRLTVSSDEPIQVVNVVSSTSGFVNNLSTTAIAGLAPRDHEAFNGRFADSGIEYRTDRGDFTFTAEQGDRFAETGEVDGMVVSFTGGYAYEAIGPDAGRVTVSYDAGAECGANLYFDSLTGGWFASYCTATDNPEGYWVTGNWAIVEDTPDTGARDDVRSFSVDFRDGPQGFVADFADLPATDTAIYELMSGFGPLPSPLGPDEALFISGHNRSGDLFMFFRGQVGGLVPGARYNATVSVEIATDTPFGCVGIGGAPGESVFVKAGVSGAEPLPVVEGNYLRMNIDKGNQSRGGEQAVVLGNVANARPCEQPRQWERKSFTARSVPAPVTASEDGRVWLLFGTDSGFEGRTRIYFTRGAVTLTSI